jgi:uncharacterized membrane protein (UPF0127 family)
MSAHTVVTIMNRTRDTVLCQRAEIASTLLSGLRGLLGRKLLEPGAGLLLRPSSGVHTWFMRFPIDVVSLDRNMKVNRVYHRVKPYRICAISLRTWSVLELPAGQVQASGTVPGDQLANL